jgi:peptidyl-prolyl cis-trans isomerase SurA
MNTNRILKTIYCFSFWIISLVAVVASVQGVNSESKLTNLPIEGVVAVVEDTVITWDELRRQLTPIVRQLEAEAQTQAEFNERLEMLTQEVLQNIIDRVLIVKEFYKMPGIDVPKSYIENEYEEYILNIFNGDRLEFLRNLQSQGKTARQFRKELKENLIISWMKSRLRKSEAEISPEKVEAYYNENIERFVKPESMHVRQLTLTLQNDESLEALQAKAQAIYKELEAGADFVTLVKQYSSDNLAKDGGDLGWVTSNELLKELNATLITLEPGQYTPVITLNNTIFILKLEEKRAKTTLPITNVREDIEAILAAKFKYYF